MGEYRIGPGGWKSRIDVTLYVEPWKEFLQKNRNPGSSYLGDFFLNYSGADNSRNPLNYEEAYYSYLKAIEHYCSEGRLHYEKPAVKEGCDEWELNYAIIKFEKFLKMQKVPATVDQETTFSGTMRRLGYLYKIRKDYENALKIFSEVLAFDKKRNMPSRFREYENQIKELEQLIRSEKR